MGVSKSQATLYIFEKLLEKGSISRTDILAVLSVSDVTFRRYIQELRAYLINFNEPYEITYKRIDDSYILKKV